MGHYADQPPCPWCGANPMLDCLPSYQGECEDPTWCALKWALDAASLAMDYAEDDLAEAECSSSGWRAGMVHFGKEKVRKTQDAFMDARDALKRYEEALRHGGHRVPGDYCDS